MRLISFAISFFLLVSAVNAASRCDCSKPPEDECRANIQLSQDNWVTINTNTEQCSRVIWYSDEDPQITIVTDGFEKEEWHGSDKPENVYIESCDVCFDRSIQGSNQTNSNNSNDCKSVDKLLTEYNQTAANYNPDFVSMFESTVEKRKICSALFLKCGEQDPKYPNSYTQSHLEKCSKEEKKCLDDHIEAQKSNRQNQSQILDRMEVLSNKICSKCEQLPSCQACIESNCFE